MRVGQKAKLKDDRGEVTITHVLSNERVKVEDTDGFERILPVSSLVLINLDNPFTEENLERGGHLSPKPKDYKKSPKRITPPSTRKQRSVGETYIDLHDHALPEKYHRQLHLSKLERALSYFEDVLWKASNSPNHKLLLNHGIGEGILKKAVRKRLDDKGYQYQDESYDNPGTTVVFLENRL